MELVWYQEARKRPGVNDEEELQSGGDRNIAKPASKLRNQRGPEMPCLRIIRKWMSMNTASSQGITKV